MKLQLTKSKQRFSKRSILKFLGMPFQTRWHEAEPILRDRIVAARRDHDEDRAKMFSGIKAFLKRNLKRSCQVEGCGVAIEAESRKCQMHRWPAVAMLLLSATLAHASPGQSKTNIMLAWSPPTNVNSVILITNGSTVETFTNVVDRYFVYANGDPSINTTNWPVIVSVPGTVTNVVLAMTPQMRFYAVTASNYWGESDFSNVAWTPPQPSDKVQLRAQ